MPEATVVVEEVVKSHEVMEVDVGLMCGSSEVDILLRTRWGVKKDDMELCFVFGIWILV